MGQIGSKNNESPDSTKSGTQIIIFFHRTTKSATNENEYLTQESGAGSSIACSFTHAIYAAQGQQSSNRYPES